MPITDDLADLFSSTISVQPGFTNVTGSFVFSGASSNYACHLEGGPTLVRNLAGQEVVSSVRAIIPTTDDLTVNNHRYTLPPPYNPRLNLKAISVLYDNDEDGEHHLTVVLP